MGISGILLTMGTSLLLTELVEVPMARLLGARGRSALLLVALANLATNPAVVYSYIASRILLGRKTAGAVLIAMEIAAVLLEARLYARTPGMMDAGMLFYGRLAAGDPGSVCGNRRFNRGSEQPRGSRPESRSAAAAALLFSILLNAASWLAGVLVSRLAG